MKELANCTAKGETWGMRNLWIVAITMCLFLGFFPLGLPSILKWYFLFTGFFTYPVFMLISLNKDDYEQGTFKGTRVEFIHVFFSFFFFVATLLAKKESFIWQSSAIYVLLSYFPYWLKSKIKKENIFYQLTNLKNDDVDRFINKNNYFINDRPYLFFYVAIIENKLDLAHKILIKFKLSLSEEAYISGTGNSEPDTISNHLINYFYQNGSSRWESVLRFLEPLGLQIDLRSAEIVKEISIGINWVDRITKEDNLNKLALRAYVNSHRNYELEVRCDDCSGTGLYHDYTDDDGEASCPYCGGRGSYWKAG